MYRIVIALVALQSCIGLASAELMAGVAKSDITPPVGGLMYGYGARGKNVSTGVHDPLYAKAIVLRNGQQHLVIVTLDLGTFTGDNLKRIKKQVARKTDLTNILCIASHSHSAPGLQVDFPSKRAPYHEDMEAKVSDAIIRASENLQPAKVGVGHGSVEEGFNRRRIVDGKAEMFWTNRDRVATSPVDYSLGLIRVDDTSGKPIAHLVNFQCHPVILGPENLEISADYPGYMMTMAEDALGGQVMFMQGAAGDINPFWDKTPPSEGAFEQAEKMGHAVAEEVIRVSKTIQSSKSDPAINFHTEIVPLAGRLDKEREDPDAHLAEVNTVLIGNDLALATFPGEFFVEHGLNLKAGSHIKNTFFIGYCNDRLRYFPTIKACAEGGYGAASATQVEVGAGERLVNRAIINLHYQADLIQP